MPSILLSDLLLNDGCTFVLIEDSLLHNGRPLLHALVDHISDSVDQIHVLTTETDPREVITSFKSEVRGKLIVHDFWTDPLGWREGTEEGSSFRVDNSDTTFLSIVQSRLGPTPSRVAVIIDTISSFLPYRKDSQISTDICSLKSSAETVPEIQSIFLFGLLHHDLHPTKSLNVLRYLTRIQVKLLNKEPKSSALKGAQGLLEVTVKKQNGKVKRQKEVYHISETRVITTAVYEDPLHDISYEDHASQPDPTANLTFNLTLKDSERRAKDNVVLPYTTKQDQTKPEQSQIFYEPDEVDDFDEEDPDDDLDI